MEWRQQTSVSCADAFTESQRWIEEVTGKSFGCNDFRTALENGVLLCNLINKLKPGIIKRLNRPSTPIASLDNLNSFLKGCEILGLNDSQLFDPCDLQDLSTRATVRRDERSRRLKNVLITIYWLGRKTNLDRSNHGPQLNLKAFEGLLGLALTKALEDGSNVSVKDDRYKKGQGKDRDDCQHLSWSSKREDSMDSLESLGSQFFFPNSPVWEGDAEVDEVSEMESTQSSSLQSNSQVPPLPWERRHAQLESRSGSASPLSSSAADAPLSPEPYFTMSPDEHVIDELFHQTLCEEDSEEDCTDPDPVLDDLYYRRMRQNHRQTSTNLNHSRFLPSQWTPEEESRVRRIFLGSQKRPWYRKMLNLSRKALADTEAILFDVTSTTEQKIATTTEELQNHFDVYQIQVRPQRRGQVNPGWIWSKSSTVRKILDETQFMTKAGTWDAGPASDWNQKGKRECDVAATDMEAQWQDDLTKWKDRRRTTNSDLQRMSKDREHVINQMSNRAVMTYGKNEAQHGVMKREQQSPRKHNPASQLYSTSPPSKSWISDLWPQTRALLTRSYATEAPSSPAASLSHYNSAHSWGSSLEAMPASDGDIGGDEAHLGSLASDGFRYATPSLHGPSSTQAQVKVQASTAAFKPTFASQISTVITTIKPNETSKSTRNRSSTLLRSNQEKQSIFFDSTVKTFSPDPTDHAQTHSAHDLNSQEERKVSGCEPVISKAQQAASSHQYMSRTCSWARSASLPRGYQPSEGSSRLSSTVTARPLVTKQSRMSSLPRLHNVDDNQGLLVNTEKVDSSPTSWGQSATVYLRSQDKSSDEQRKAHKARQSSTKWVNKGSRASLPPQASFQTTQPHLMPQPYSNPQLHHNESWSMASDESSHNLKVDHSDTRVSLTLKPNSTLDFGFQAQWNSSGARVKSIVPGGPAELCRLFVDDEIVAVDGVLVAHMRHSQWKDKMASALQKGSLVMDIRRYGNKDWRTNEKKYQKQPSQSQTTFNLTTSTAALKGPSDHRAAAGKKSKSNRMTDSKIQGEVKRGVLSDNPRTATSKDFSMTKKNQKRRAEFFKEKGGSESAISDLQVPSISASSSGWSWDREEDRRRQEKWQEEQERLLQEQYQRDQERLEAEWQRAQQEAMEVTKSQMQSTYGMTTDDESLISAGLHVMGQMVKTREEQSPHKEELKRVEATSQRTLQGVQSNRITPKEWADVSCGFTRLSSAHKTKSLSTSVLADTHKQTRSDLSRNKGQKISKAEQDRQQVLEEMKKRTLLLTDNSWIRQRNTGFYKEPVYTGAPLKRYESLDNLNSLRRSSSLNTCSFSRPQSAAASFCAPTRNSYSRYNTATSTESSHSSAGAVVDVSLEHRVESRFEAETGSPAVSPAISNSSPISPSPINQHAVLEIEE